MTEEEDGRGRRDWSVKKERRKKLVRKRREEADTDKKEKTIEFLNGGELLLFKKMRPIFIINNCTISHALICNFLIKYYKKCRCAFIDQSTVRPCFIGAKLSRIHRQLAFTCLDFHI